MEYQPKYATTPRGWEANLTTASGATEGGLTAPSNIVSLIVAPSTGSFVNRFKITGRGALTAGLVRFFKKVGSNYILWHEESVPTTSALSATNKAYDSGWITVDWKLESGDEIHVTTTQTHNLNVVAEGGE